jgi:hypothetical protein
MVCGIDASLAIYNMEVVESGKCWKFGEFYARFGLGMFKHLPHIAGTDGHCIMSVTDFCVCIISLLCHSNLTT